MRTHEGLAWPEVFGHALRHGSGTVDGLSSRSLRLPVTQWQQEADSSDLALLGHCRGATLDVGCGPGRMTEALVHRGHLALGIDVVAEAVEQARARGVSALVRDVFAQVPGERRWDSVLLADGNIGIGGDPVRLLRRLHALLAPVGRVVADLAGPGVGLRTSLVTITSGGRRSGPFPWSQLGTGAVHEAGADSGFAVAGVHEYDGRWFAVFQKVQS